MRTAPTLHLGDSDKTWLVKSMNSAVSPRRLVERCQIVLLAAEGMINEKIADVVGCSVNKVGRWRTRFALEGRDGIESDRPGRGRKLTYTDDVRKALVKETTNGTPPEATHWSRTSMAKLTGLSPSTVGRIWVEHGLKPHLSATFKVSNDPLFAEKVEDIVGLYLNVPEHAIVLCCDEKSQIQALDRTQPGLPLKKGRAGTMTHDYVRHGTATLFAALNVADGTVIAQCQSRHRHQEWLKFLKQLDENTPQEKELHLVLDNYATHKHAKVKAWVAKHPRFHLHFTPTSASWLNLVERFFRELTEQRLRRGVFYSVEHLVEALHAYIAERNKDSKPFVWTAKAPDILTKVARAREKLSRVETVY